MWPPEAGSLGRPAYRSLAQRVIDAVAAGVLAPGTRLPAHRTLAFELGVSVQTVSRAYEELTRLGIVSGEVGRGSFVRADAADPRTPWHRIADGADRPIDLSMLTPVRSAAHTRRFCETLAQIAADPSEATLHSFRPTATLSPHCEQAVRWLARCGVPVPADRVLPTNGSTSAMTVALMTAAAPGETVAAEEMSHHTLKALTAALGLRLTAIAMDEDGMLPDALDRACASQPVRVVYLMPEGLGPLARRMGQARREQIVAVARRRQLAIVENDAWGPLQPGRGAPLAALAPERTLYFTGLTKCCLPGLRIGWLVAPDHMATSARTRHLVTSWMATALVADVASRWLADGTAADLLRWQRSALAARNATAREVLGGHRLGSTASGLHVWLGLPEPWDEAAFVALARQAGVAVAGGSAFATRERAGYRGIRICLGGVSQRDLRRGLEILARLTRSRPEPVHLTY